MNKEIEQALDIITEKSLQLDNFPQNSKSEVTTDRMAKVCFDIMINYSKIVGSTIEDEEIAIFETIILPTLEIAINDCKERLIKCPMAKEKYCKLAEKYILEML